MDCFGQKKTRRQGGKTEAAAAAAVTLELGIALIIKKWEEGGQCVCLFVRPCVCVVVLNECLKSISIFRPIAMASWCLWAFSWHVDTYSSIVFFLWLYSSAAELDTRLSRGLAGIAGMALLLLLLLLLSKRRSFPTWHVSSLPFFRKSVLLLLL